MIESAVFDVCLCVSEKRTGEREQRERERETVLKFMILFFDQGENQFTTSL